MGRNVNTGEGRRGREQLERKWSNKYIGRKERFSLAKPESNGEDVKVNLTFH